MIQNNWPSFRNLLSMFVLSDLCAVDPSLAASNKIGAPKNDSTILAVSSTSGNCPGCPGKVFQSAMDRLLFFLQKIADFYHVEE